MFFLKEKTGRGAQPQVLVRGSAVNHCSMIILECSGVFVSVGSIGTMFNIHISEFLFQYETLVRCMRALRSWRLGGN